jgi:hypothetical protein
MRQKGLSGSQGTGWGGSHEWDIPYFSVACGVHGNMGRPKTTRYLCHWTHILPQSPWASGSLELIVSEPLVSLILNMSIWWRGAS